MSKILIPGSIAVIYCAGLITSWAIMDARQSPVWKTCFQYDLVINQAISPETAATLSQELIEVAPKIAEACARAEGRKEP